MKKNILFYFLKGDSDGGADHSLYTHLLNLKTDNYKYFVIFRKYNSYVKNLENLGFETIHLPAKKVLVPNLNKSTNNSTKKEPFLKKYLRTVKLFINALPEALVLRKIIKKNNIDLLHLNHNLHGDRAGIIAGILTGKKIISHNRGLHQPIQIDVILSKFIDKIICISDFVKEEYVRYGINSNKCTTIYNGVDIDRFNPTNKPIKKNIVGCIGRLEEWKGQQVLIKAIPDVIKLFPDLNFYFIGSGSNTNNLIKLVEKLKIKKYVSFLGSITNVTELLETFTIAVHTSIEPEPFGRVIIEAMSMNKPVISTNIGGPKEIIRNGVDGFLIEPNNSGTLANKIIELLTNDSLCNRIGQEARKTVLEKFDAKLTSKKIATVYDTVLN